MGTGANRMVGFHPLVALMGAPPLAGSVHATTGNATATSPFTGTVVEGLSDAVPSADGPPVDDDVPRRLLPHPASIDRPRTATAGTNLADLPSCHQPRLELLVMSYDDMSGTAAYGVHAPRTSALKRMNQMDESGGMGPIRPGSANPLYAQSGLRTHLNSKSDVRWWPPCPPHRTTP